MSALPTPRDGGCERTTIDASVTYDSAVRSTQRRVRSVTLARRSLEFHTSETVIDLVIHADCDDVTSLYGQVIRLADGEAEAGIVVSVDGGVVATRTDACGQFGLDVRGPRLPSVLTLMPQNQSPVTCRIPVLRERRTV